MSISANDLEQKTLEDLRKNFESRAYRFIEHPSEDEIPRFLDSYRPDALAFGEHDRVIIEIKIPGGLRSNKIDLAEIANRIPPNEDWRYVVVYAGQDPSEALDIPRSNKFQIDHAIKEVRELSAAGHDRAAMLQIWSVLEALARRIYPHDIRFTQRPLSPAEIVERLAMEGELDVDEAKRIRSLRSLRNLLAHGDFETKILKDDVAFILALVDRINANAST